MCVESPAIHPEAVVLKSRLGCCVEVAARTQITESIIGDYSYVMNDGDVIYSHIGKFCSIASHVRINPGNHPFQEGLLQLAWWNWPRAVLRAALDDFRSLSAEAFVDRYRHVTALSAANP